MSLKQKFDNMSSNFKAIGTIAKEGMKVAGLKVQIRQRQRTNRALRNMSAGKANKYRHSAGMASGVSKKRSDY